MNATYAYGKYDKNDRLMVENLYSDDTLVDISEVEAQQRFENLIKLASELGIPGKATLFKLEPIQTLES